MSNTSMSDFFERSDLLKKARAAGMVQISYLTQINEQQRELIHMLLSSALADPNVVNKLRAAPSDKLGDNALEEAKFLLEQFGETLVRNENQTPGSIHGLCL